MSISLLANKFRSSFMLICMVCMNLSVVLAQDKNEKQPEPESIFQKIVAVFRSNVSEAPKQESNHPYVGEAAKKEPFLNSSPHIFQYNHYEDSTLKGEQQWAYSSDVKYDPALKPRVSMKGGRVHKDFNVFGFHPYWMGNAYYGYHYDLLSTVAYCSYEVDPNTGNYKNIHSWKTTAVIDSMHNHGQKVVLTITNMGALDNAKFFVNPAAQQTLIDSVSLLVIDRKADGICVDFEDVPKFYKDHYTDFVTRLSKAMKDIDTLMEVYITIPAVNVDDVYDVQALDNYVDQFILLAYGYYGQADKIAGPNAPLQSKREWSMYTIDNSVKYYNEVLGIKRRKLLLGIAYYGNFFETKDMGVPSQVLQYNYSKPYSYIRYLMESRSEDALLDEESSSEYLSMPQEDGTGEEVWFDGERSLQLKYNYALEKGLGGIAIWGLGYDNGYTELWQLLANSFSDSNVNNVRSNMTRDANGDWIFAVPKEEESSAEALETTLEDAIGDNGVKSVILVMLLLLSAFFLLGFIVSFANESLQVLFRDRITVIYFVIHVIVLMAVLVFELFYDIEANWIMFIYGVILSSLFMSLLYLITKSSKEQP